MIAITVDCLKKHRCGADPQRRGRWIVTSSSAIHDKVFTRFAMSPYTKNLIHPIRVLEVNVTSGYWILHAAIIRCTYCSCTGCAGGETRTLKALRPTDFESVAYTNSATPARFNE